MVKKRVRSLLKIYFSIAVIITVAFCFNGFADNYYIDKLSNNTVVKEGDILKAGDYIFDENDYNSYYSGVSIHYLSDPGGDYLENDYSYSPFEGKYRYEVKKIGDYSLWKVEDLSYYHSSLSDITLVPIKIDGPENQKVTRGMAAKFRVEPSDELGDNLTYEWYKLDEIKADIPQEDVRSNYMQTSNNDGVITYTVSQEYGGYIEIYMPVKATELTFDYTNVSGSLSIQYGGLDIGNIYGQSGTKTIHFNEISDYYRSTITISSSSSFSIKNLKYKYKTSTRLSSDTKELIVSSKENSSAFEDNNKFYAIVKKGDKSYESKVAKLNIVEGKKDFPTPEGDKLITVEEFPKEYKLKIFNITDKVENTAIDKINSNLEKDYKSIEVFNVGMYLNDELIDIVEGNYLLKINKPK